MQTSNERYFWTNNKFDSNPIEIKSFNSCVNFVIRNNDQAKFYTLSESKKFEELRIDNTSYIVSLVTPKKTFTFEVSCQLIPDYEFNYAVVLLNFFNNQNISKNDFDSITGYVRAITELKNQKTRYVQSIDSGENSTVIKIKNTPPFMLDILDTYAA